MKTPKLQRSLKGIVDWIIRKIGFAFYMFCMGSPIGLFITNLFIVGIERKSSPILSISMALLLHPATFLPIGVFAKVLGQFAFKELEKHHSNSLRQKIFNRIFTYSLNCHLSMIACVSYYLYELWVIFKDSTTLNFSNNPFDQCICDYILPQYNVTCTNEETENSFQNKFLNMPTKQLLIAQIILSFICHLLHSLMTFLPLPITLLDLIIGNESEYGENESAMSSNTPEEIK